MCSFTFKMFPKLNALYLASLFSISLFIVVSSSIHVTKINTVLLSEAFYIPIERSWFEQFNPDDDLEFSASLLDMPDLPNWMFCHHPNASPNAFLYGSAEELGPLHIDLLALNRRNYKTDQKVMKLNVEPRENVALYEVEMKFLNLNVEDMFKAGRLERLVEIFRNILWSESPIIYVTKVVSSLDVGGRLPLNPKEKEGVVVRIGGTSEFSRTLEDLELEVQPLRNRIPCPRNYKRTSVEHVFRKRNFIADWCSYRLISDRFKSQTGRESHDPSYSSISLQSDNYKPQSLNYPRRDFLFDFIVSIVIPSAVVGILSTTLTCVMCCNRDGIEKKMDENEATMTQLNHFNSVSQSTLNPTHKTSSERDNNSYAPPRSLSLPPSEMGSPASTLRKSGAASTLSRK